MASEFTARIRAVLDTSGIASDISKIEKHTINLSNLKLDAGNLTKQIESALAGKHFSINVKDVKVNTNSVSSQMNSAGVSAGTGFANSFISSLNKINLKNGMSSITENI